MDVRSILPAKLQKVWNALELQFLVLLSLFLQVVLIATGNRRKYSNNKWLAAAVWLSYLSADSVATLALGILSQAGGESENVSDPKYTITVFWAPFLLMHMGGPDTITAYALADNELWSRHLLSLIGQVFVAIYVFLRSFTAQDLNFVWVVIFLAGFVKYGERSWVLFSASKDRFRDSMVSGPDPGPNYAKFMDELVAREKEGYRVSLVKAIEDGSSSSSLLIAPAEEKNRYDVILETSSSTAPEQVIRLQKANAPSFSIPPEPNAERRIETDVLVQEPQRIPAHKLLWDAYSFFGTFRKLFADLILSFQDREESLSFFQTLHWEDAFGVVEIELGLVFDLLYTKSSLVFSPAGVFLRFFSCLSTITAFIAFLVINKNSYPKTEVIITYFLLLGAIFLESYAVVMLVLSDRMMILLKSDWSKLPKFVSWLQYLRIVPARKRWSNSMGQYNVLNHCLAHMPKHSKANWCCGKLDQYIERFNQYLDKYLFWKHESVTDDLKKVIFDELKRRAIDGPNKPESYWKDNILIEEMKGFNESGEIEFDQSILMWQIATDLCYTKAEQGELEESVKTKREGCRLLSNYMVHLLMVSPFMLPSGIGQIRIQDTYAEATEFFNFEKNLSKEEACKMITGVDARFVPSVVKGDRSKSLLFDACRLAKALEKMDAGRRWEKMKEAWVGMLLFAAAQCSWSDHAEKLSQGGELLTHVWLLMAHFGLTDEFQITKGYVRAKLESK